MSKATLWLLGLGLGLGLGVEGHLVAVEVLHDDGGVRAVEVVDARQEARLGGVGEM